mgnify:CR=1 FL=1
MSSPLLEVQNLWSGYGSGDILQAQARGAEAATPVNVAYAIPKEGAIVWFDMLAIPADAPHPDNAHKFINYIMEPAVIAAISNYVAYANGNAANIDHRLEVLSQTQSVSLRSVVRELSDAGKIQASFLPRSLPPVDGGLSYGQTVVAAGWWHPPCLVGPGQVGAARKRSGDSLPIGGRRRQ